MQAFIQNRKPQTIPSLLVQGLVMIALISASFTSAASADEVDVYLLGGQSNMQGIGMLANLPDTIPKQIPNTYFYQDKTFQPMILGKTKTSTRAGEFGPEVGLAIEVASSQRPIYLIKYSASGMPLHHGWKGNKWVGGSPGKSRRNFYPGLTSSDETQGQLYRQMVARFRAGLDQLRKEGHVPTVRGFAWMQGEQDSKNKESATQYAASLKRLCERLSDDMKTIEPLAVAYGQVLPHEPALSKFTYRSEIREQMTLADADSGHASRIVNAKMVSTDGFGVLPDTVHYDAAGQLRLGKELGKALKALDQGKQPPPPQLHK